MNEKQVGPFMVKSLNVEDGLDLVAMAQSADPSEFQKAVILRCVTKDGKPINEFPFSEVLPHLSKLVEEAFELNGFRGAEE